MPGHSLGHMLTPLTIDGDLRGLLICHDVGVAKNHKLKPQPYVV